MLRRCFKAALFLQVLEQEKKRRELFSDIIDIAKPTKGPKVETAAVATTPKAEKLEEVSEARIEADEEEDEKVDEEAQKEAMKRELKERKRRKRKEQKRDSEPRPEDSPPPVKKAKKKKKAKSYLDDL